MTLKLPLAGLNEQVIVRTTDRRPRQRLTSSLSEQEIAELPDDPDELEQVLIQMAGPGATIRVNGFGGAACRRSRRSDDPVPHELVRGRESRGGGGSESTSPRSPAWTGGRG